ncbi:hypothetical protein QJ850_gp471 [Acanthamoeba polyphaga mimivirus]|uniref:Uncharacterized protein n=1 Tax=Acanthamoeba polyphaga mimivirus Kroon TaxID=3069720 RepID=A0A0G2Y386_9VIRU|nr:hypothetical protein QJ850_gp471 [Acanthamoeba polyphaga mimivirus]AKI80228.1 hypothetical protein [Acanthamoeba polyphaga mimivirus Kroon]
MSCITTNNVKILIILIIFVVIVWQFYYYATSKHNNNFLNKKIAIVPHDIKCLFNQPNCSEADVDGWSLIQAFIYFIVGLIIPNKYLIIIIVSIILEILKPFIGFEPKYIIAPLLNTTGYIVGSMLSPCKNNYKEKYQIFE